MRSVVVGLVLAVGLVAGAQAKDCRLDGAAFISNVRASGEAQVEVGAEFKVVRATSKFATLGPDTFKPGEVSGKIVVELASGARRFVVAQDYSPGSSPWAAARSWEQGSTESPSGWKGRDRKNERRIWAPTGVFDVYGGPLRGLTLTQANCR